MVIKKVVCIVVLLLTFNHGVNAQDKSTLQKLRTLYKEQGIGPLKKSIYYNRIENNFDIDDIIVPLNSIKINYKYADQKHWVEFQCLQTIGCIILQTDDKNSNNIGVAIEFKNKSACYNFIDLIGILKSQNKTD